VIFDPVRAYYDDHADRWLKLRKSRSTERIQRLLAKNLSVQRGCAIDLGCGTGVHGEILVGQFAEVCGIDISLNMLKSGRAYRESMDFVQADAVRLPVKERSVDMMICTGLVEHVKNVDELFREIFRVLKPNGLFSVSALNKSSIWNKFGSWKYPSGLRYYRFSEINDIARAAGFRKVGLDYALWAGILSSSMPRFMDRLDSFLPFFFCYRFVAVYKK